MRDGEVFRGIRGVTFFPRRKKVTKEVRGKEPMVPLRTLPLAAAGASIASASADLAVSGLCSGQNGSVRITLPFCHQVL